jgi:hypothetical protein
MQNGRRTSPVFDFEYKHPLSHAGAWQMLSAFENAWKHGFVTEAHFILFDYEVIGLCGGAGAPNASCGVRQGLQTLGVDCLPTAFTHSINALLDAADCRFNLCEEPFEVSFQCKVLTDLFYLEAIIANIVA